MDIWNLGYPVGDFMSKTCNPWKDDKISRLETELDEARDGLSQKFEIMKKENNDMRQRNEHLEREIESKLHFIEQQDRV